MAAPLLFAEAFEEELGYGKYTNWVLRGRFSADHLLCLLAMISEFDAHALPILRALTGESSKSGAERSVLALAALHSFVQGERFDRNAWARRMQLWRIMSDGRLSPEPEGDSPPAAPHSAADALAGLPARDARARWAADPPCAPEHVQCLLWLVGEFSARAQPLLVLLESCRERLAGAERALVALQAMHQMVWMNERIDLAEFDARAVRGRGELQFIDLPESVRTALQEAAPGARWDAVRKVAWGYLLVNRAEDAGAGFEAEVRPPRAVALKRYLQWNALPAPAAGRLAERFPDIDKVGAYGRLAADGAIGAYEVEYHPKRGKIRRPRRILVSPDGGEIGESEF